MTFTLDFDFWALSVYALLFVLAALNVLASWGLKRVTKDTDELMVSIHKLVQSNNIDRAIKCCNAEPENPLATACKGLLVVSNRGESDLMDAYEIQLKGLEVHFSKYMTDSSSWLTLSLNLACNLVGFGILYLLNPTALMAIAVLLLMLTSSGPYSGFREIRKSRPKYELALLELWKRLINRKVGAFGSDLI